MGKPIVDIDLHGLFQDEVVMIRESIIMDEYKYDPKVLRIEPGDNQGVTVLVLREL